LICLTAPLLGSLSSFSPSMRSSLNPSHSLPHHHDYLRFLTNAPSFLRLFTLAVTGSTRRGPALVRRVSPLLRPPSLRVLLRQGRPAGRWNAERPSGDLSSVRFVLSRTDLDSKRILEENYDSAAHSQDMPRGHEGIVGAPRRCLPLPYRVIYQATLLLPPPFFFMQVTNTHPSHMIISHSSTHRLCFGGHLAPVHFILVFSHLVCLVFSTTYPLSLFHSHSHTHAHPLFVVF
jgi:hypothetical protein